jgi:hypothetical protein
MALIASEKILPLHLSHVEILCSFLFCPCVTEVCSVLQKQFMNLGFQYSSNYLVMEFVKLFPSVLIFQDR